VGATDLGFGKTGMTTAAVTTVLIDYFFATKQYIQRHGFFESKFVCINVSWEL
jgi:hypothetical protein